MRRSEEFRINEFITLKLEDEKTNIYIKDRIFFQCRSIWKRTPEEEFWEHCSNIQAWVENNYDTRLLHSRLAFPLLKKLVDTGDPLARSVYKEEIADRISKRNSNIIEFLLRGNYLKSLNREELTSVFEELDREIFKDTEIQNFLPLLKYMADNGVIKARNILKKKQFYRNLENITDFKIKTILEEEYLDYVSEEELITFFTDFNFSEFTHIDPKYTLPFLKSLSDKGIKQAQKLIREIAEDFFSTNPYIKRVLEKRNFKQYLNQNRKRICEKVNISEIKTYLSLLIREIFVSVKENQFSKKFSHSKTVLMSIIFVNSKLRKIYLDETIKHLSKNKDSNLYGNVYFELLTSPIQILKILIDGVEKEIEEVIYYLSKYDNFAKSCDVFYEIGNLLSKAVKKRMEDIIRKNDFDDFLVLLNNYYFEGLSALDFSELLANTDLNLLEWFSSLKKNQLKDLYCTQITFKYLIFKDEQGKKALSKSIIANMEDRNKQKIEFILYFGLYKHIRDKDFLKLSEEIKNHFYIFAYNEGLRFKCEGVEYEGEMKALESQFIRKYIKRILLENDLERIKELFWEEAFDLLNPSDCKSLWTNPDIDYLDYFIKVNLNLEKDSCYSEWRLPPKRFISYGVEIFLEDLINLLKEGDYDTFKFIFESKLFEYLTIEDINRLLENNEFPFLRNLLKYYKHQGYDSILKKDQGKIKYSVLKDNIIKFIKEIIKTDDYDTIFKIWDYAYFYKLKEKDLIDLIKSDGLLLIEKLLKSFHFVPKPTSKYETFTDYKIQSLFPIKTERKNRRYKRIEYLPQELIKEYILKITKKGELETLIPLLAMNFFNLLTQQDFKTLYEYENLNFRSKLLEILTYHKEELYFFNEEFWTKDIPYLFKFKINNYIDLHIIGGETFINIKNNSSKISEVYRSYKPTKERDQYQTHYSLFNSKNLDKILNKHKAKKLLKLPQAKFWRHCAIIKQWVDNDYDKNYLNYRLAYQLLKHLTLIEARNMKKRFKRELKKGLFEGDFVEVKYIIKKGYLELLESEELFSLFKNFDYSKIKNHPFEEALPILKLMNFQKVPGPGAKKLFYNEIKRYLLGTDDKAKNFILDEKYLTLLPINEIDLVFKEIDPSFISEFKYIIENLSEVPKSVKNLTSLRKLDLSHNNLTSIEPITELTSLEYLSLYENKIVKLPETLKNLTSLKTLNLSYNKISDFQNSLTYLSSLEKLSLRENNISTLPKSIRKLKNLKDLSLARNRISSLPDSIGNLVHLQTLELQDNKLKNLPESIYKLKSIKELNLMENKITQIPETIGYMSSLKRIYLEDNELTDLPKSLLELNSLKYVHISNNPLNKEARQILRKLRKKGVSVFK